MLDLLKKNVRKYLENESVMNAGVKRNITNQINALMAKEERLFDFFLDGNIEKSVYETKKAEIEVEKTELQDTSAKYAVIGEEMKETVENVLDVVANASILMKNSDPNQKRELLGLLFDDCVLDGQRLLYTLRKPFDRLVKSPVSKDWLCVQTNELEHFMNLTDDISRFKENLKNSNP